MGAFSGEIFAKDKESEKRNERNTDDDEKQNSKM